MNSAEPCIFISYSHAAQKRRFWKARLLERLAVFTRQDLVAAWDDTAILSDWRWRTEIESQIHRTTVETFAN